MFIFASGGHALKTVERYDVAADSWLMMPEMNEVRKGHACVALGDHIYAICGH